MMRGVQIYIRRASPKDHAPRVGCNADQRQPRKDIRVRSTNSDLRISHRFQGKRVIANEVVTRSHLIHDLRVEGVNTLNRRQPMMELPLIVEARNVWTIEQREGPGRIRKEKPGGHPGFLIDSILDVRIELILVEFRSRRAGISTRCLRSRNQKS